MINLNLVKECTKVLDCNLRYSGTIKLSLNGTIVYSDMNTSHGNQLEFLNCQQLLNSISGQKLARCL